jgi:hypothetical protein
MINASHPAGVGFFGGPADRARALDPGRARGDVMRPFDLAADCARCAALCCTHLAFDTSPAFAYTKPAGVTCRHVTPAGTCGIYASREARGFAGCVAYDCHGAGPRATRLIASSRLTEREQHDVFAALRDVHELLAAATRLGAPGELAAELEALDRACDSVPFLLALDLGPLRRRLADRLRGDKVPNTRRSRPDRAVKP